MKPIRQGATARPRWLAVPAAVAIMVALTAGTCAPRPSLDTSAAQMITDMSDAIIDIHGQMAEMQGQIDSLRAVTARQDSLLSRLATAQGIPVPQP